MAVKALSPNHWTAREFPTLCVLYWNEKVAPPLWGWENCMRNSSSCVARASVARTPASVCSLHNECQVTFDDCIDVKANIRIVYLNVLSI